MQKSTVSRIRLPMLLLLCAAVCLTAMSGCGKTARTSAFSGGVMPETEFGGVYIDSTIDDFNALGYTYGDSVNITFSNGYTLEDLPYYNGYYTQNGEALLVAYPGYPYIKAAINNGDDLWKVAGLQTGDTAQITLAQRGKYLAVQQARDIHYTDARTDYESDAVFANFRSVQAGDLAENRLFRSASPCDNQHNRAPFVDKLMAEAGVGFILNLADNDEKIQGYLADPAFSCPGFRALYEAGRVVPVALNMNYGSEEFRSKIAGGLTAMAERQGPYLVHCTEGKDRTGFVCMLLEALCGASYDEIERDYMQTYENYYGISLTNQKDKYDTIVESVLLPMLQTLTGAETDVKTADLSAGAQQFLLGCGMQEAQIAALREQLCGSDTAAD